MCMRARVQIKAGLRVAVQPHGGHFWSSMGQVQRPMDIVSLRIDNQARSPAPHPSPFHWLPLRYNLSRSISAAQCLTAAKRGRSRAPLLIYMMGWGGQG